MYEWLPESLSKAGTVVTANRRLSRALKDQFALQQLAAGEKAWRSPEIYAWQDWLVQLTSDISDQDNLPTRLNANQSQVLWERCLRKEVGNAEAGIPSLYGCAVRHGNGWLIGKYR